MAYHATQTLSFQLPLPSFAVVETDDVHHAAWVIRGGGSAHVSTRELAAQVLTRLGLDAETVEDRLHFATTGRLRRHS